MAVIYVLVNLGDRYYCTTIWIPRSTTWGDQSMSEMRKIITVRNRRTEKSYQRASLSFFLQRSRSLLTVCMLSFARNISVLMIRMHRILARPRNPSGPEHLLGNGPFREEICFSRVSVGSTTSIYATLLLVAIDHCGGNGDWHCLWLVGVATRYASDAYFRFVFLAFPPACICTGCCRSFGRRFIMRVIALAVSDGQSLQACERTDTGAKIPLI